MQWQTPRELHSPWASISADGYYRIAREGEKFVAHHVEALWATPEPIGTRDRMSDAQLLCEQHAARTPAPV